MTFFRGLLSTAAAGGVTFPTTWPGQSWPVTALTALGASGPYLIQSSDPQGEFGRSNGFPGARADLYVIHAATSGTFGVSCTTTNGQFPYPRLYASNGTTLLAGSLSTSFAPISLTAGQFYYLEIIEGNVGAQNTGYNMTLSGTVTLST